MPFSRKVGPSLWKVKEIFKKEKYELLVKFSITMKVNGDMKQESSEQHGFFVG